MEKFINNTKRLIFHKQKDILSSALILSSMFILARIFGFLRYRTYNSYFPKEEIGLFLAAFRIPDIVFEIIITGALSAAFIPLFIKYKTQNEKLSTNISTIINFLFGILFFFIIIIFILLDKITPLIMPGFPKNEMPMVVSISRILIISQLPFMIVGSILSSISQANRMFIITALAPIFYNLGIIFGTILFSQIYGIYGPVIGVIIGSSLFFVIQLPAIFITHFKYRITALNREVLPEFVRLVLPRFLTVITKQIDLTVDLFLASLRGPGPYAIFYYAQSVQFFPVTFIGVAFGQAALPYLSELHSEKKIAELKRIFTDSILQLLFLSVPLSLFFIFARTPLIRFALGGPKFDWEGTVQTAKALSYFAISIPFHTIFYFVTRAFYATHDTKTPFKINAFSTIINTGLSVYFISFLNLPVWALALSFSIAVSINILLLLYFFYKRINGFDLKKLIKNSIKIYIAAFLSALLAYIFMKLLDTWILDTTRTINVFLLLSLVFGLFSFLYLFISWLINNEEIYLLGTLIVKIKQLKQMITEVHTDTGS